jgi:hypothetical protein
MPLFMRMFLGIWFAGMVAVVSFMALVQGSPVLALVGVLAVAAWGYPMGFLKNRLTLDLRARTYVWEHGLYPFIDRQQGSLDAIEHLYFGQINLPGSQGSRYTAWWLRFLPEDAAASAGEPPAVIVSGGLSLPDRNQMLPLAEQLAQKTRLPLKDASREPPVPMETIAAEAKARKVATHATRPRLSPSAWMGILFATGFLGMIGWGVLLSRHANRGAHFPVQLEEKVVINHLLRDCRVESFLVTLGPSRQEFRSGGDGGSQVTTVTQYKVSLDVVPARPGVTTAKFVVGMGGNGQLTWSDRTVVFSERSPHQSVTLQMTRSGSGPEYVLLRDVD